MLPIGGLKEKILGAVGRDYLTVIPAENEADLEDLPEEVRNQIKVHPVEDLGHPWRLCGIRRGERKAPLFSKGAGGRRSAFFVISSRTTSWSVDVEGPTFTASPDSRTGPFGTPRAGLRRPDRFARRAEPERQSLRAVEARGKHLFHHWRDGPISTSTSGCSGISTDYFAASRRVDGPVVSTAGATWDLIGPRPASSSAGRALAILDRLGPIDLLSRGESVRRAAAAIDRAIGHALMDQRVVAGIGNIYRAEILFLTGLHPLDPRARRLGLEGWSVSGSSGAESERANWTIEPMERPRSTAAAASTSISRDLLRCGSRIATFLLTGRTMFACETCQPRTTRKRPASRRKSRGTIPTL